MRCPFGAAPSITGEDSPGRYRWRVRVYPRRSSSGGGGGPRMSCELGSAGLPMAALGELVLADGEQAVFGADGGEFREVALDLLPDAAERDAEDALAALKQVDHFVGGRALIDADAVAHQGDLGQVAGAAVAQVVHCGADLLQRDAGVEQALDHLQDQDVAEAVEALGAGAVRPADAGLDQAGAGPVVELTVGDAGRVAGRGPAVADLGPVTVGAQGRGDL